MKIISELEKIGLTLTDEQKSAITKKFSEDVISNFEHEKKVSKAETERDNWKERAETAEETLKGFDGKSLEDITKERDEWKRKAEEAEKDYTAKLEAREKEDLLKEAFAEVKFTSEAAKRAIMSQISESVTVKNGKLIGFNDLLADARKNDAEAFVNEEDEKNKNNSAQFTDPMNRGQAEPITGDPNKMDFATYKKWRAQNQ